MLSILENLTMHISKTNLYMCTHTQIYQGGSRKWNQASSNSGWDIFHSEKQ